MGLRELKRERTRRLIADKAFELFTDHGFGRTTVEQIAAAAEVGPSTLYRYFPTKETLVLEFIEDCLADAVTWFREQPRLVGDLTRELGLSQPGTSKHLRVLREAGLVTVRRDAQRRWYELRPEPLAAMDEWLTPYRWMWEDRLDALERHLDEMPDDPEDTDRPAREDDDR